MPNFSGMWYLKEQIQSRGLDVWTGSPLNDIYAWGGTTSSPVQITSDISWSELSTGSAVIAIKKNGTIFSCGAGASTGQNTTDSITTFTQIGTSTGWQSASSDIYSVAAINNGSLYMWGGNSCGQLGQNNIINTSSPVQVGALTTWAQTANGVGNSTNRGHTLAIKTDGTLWAWGDNSRGQLGQNNLINLSSPVQVGALTNWAKITAGQRFSVAIKTDGTMWSWGYNSNTFLQLGCVGTTSYISSPTQIGDSTNWATVNSGWCHSLAIKTDGTLWSWGGNSRGQIGNGSQSGGAGEQCYQIGAFTDWTGVYASSESSWAIRNKQLYAWGLNNSGILGDGTTINRSSPVQIGALACWTCTQGTVALFENKVK